jgi:hypothetical protein
MADSISPSFLGGLMAALQGSQSAPGLQNAGTSPLMNMGLGLMSAAAPHLYVRGNVGEALANAQQATMQNRAAQQNMGMNDLQMQMLRAQLPLTQATYAAAGRFLNPQGGTATQPGPTAPQGPMTAPASSASPMLPISAQMPQQQPGGVSMTGDPQQALNIGMAGSLVGMKGADAFLKYPENVTAAQKALQTQRQMQAQGQMGALDTIATAPNADKIVASNPQLLAQWRQIAPQLGLDATKAPTAQEAQTYARFAYNQMAGNAGLPTKEMPHPLQTVTLKDGRTAQIDPITGKETVIEPSELQQVVGPNGTPILVPKGQAAGMQPFNATIFGAGDISDQSKELAYQQWKATGNLPTGFSRNPVMNAQMMNFISQRANQEGIPGVQAAAQHQVYQAQQGVVNAFTKGKEAQSLNAINTAVQHMDLLPPLISALNSGNLTVLNKAQNFFKKQTGDPAPTNFAAIKEFVGGEVAKAVLPGGGGESERKALTDPLNAANSPTQLKSAVETIQKALAGKTEALRNQWEVGTNGTQGSFDKFLLPATKNALGITDQPAAPPARPGQQATPPMTNAQGWTLHRDAKGNQAYVSPDGKQFQEVK